MDNLHYRFRAAKHDGRRLQAASERNGRHWSGHFVWRNTTADFELFIASIGMSFVTGNNKGSFRYIMGKFEDFLSISSRENALRVTSLENKRTKDFSGFTAVVCPLAEVQFGSCPPLLNFLNYS